MYENVFEFLDRTESNNPSFLELNQNLSVMESELERDIMLTTAVLNRIALFEQSLDNYIDLGLESSREI